MRASAAAVGALALAVFAVVAVTATAGADAGVFLFGGCPQGGCSSTRAGVALVPLWFAPGSRASARSLGSLLPPGAAVGTGTCASLGTLAVCAGASAGGNCTFVGFALPDTRSRGERAFALTLGGACATRAAALIDPVIGLAFAASAHMLAMVNVSSTAAPLWTSAYTTAGAVTQTENGFLVTAGAHYLSVFALQADGTSYATLAPGPDSRLVGDIAVVGQTLYLAVCNATDGQAALSAVALTQSLASRLTVVWSIALGLAPLAAGRATGSSCGLVTAPIAVVAPGGASTALFVALGDVVQAWSDNGADAELLWRVDMGLGASERAVELAATGALVVAGCGDSVVALDSSSGALVWRTNLTATLAIDSRRVELRSRLVVLATVGASGLDGTLVADVKVSSTGTAAAFALDLATGALLWCAPHASPLIDGAALVPVFALPFNAPPAPPGTSFYSLVGADVSGALVQVVVELAD